MIIYRLHMQISLEPQFDQRIGDTFFFKSKPKFKQVKALIMKKYNLQNKGYGISVRDKDILDRAFVTLKTFMNDRRVMRTFGYDSVSGNCAYIIAEKVRTED